MKTANYPPVSNVNLPIDVWEVVKQWLIIFNKDVRSMTLGRIFMLESYWRDHLTLSWEFHTLHGLPQIERFLQRSGEGSNLVSIAVDDSEASRYPKLTALDPDKKVKCIEVFLVIKTIVGGGRGVARLVQDPEDNTWKAYTLYTSLQWLDEHPEPTKHLRPSGLNYGDRNLGKNWVDHRSAQTAFEEHLQPTVLIIGAGQAGLLTAARLKQLNVPSLVIDRNARVGDNWRNRYKSLILHDPVWYNHLPYLPFPENWPVFTPKDKLAGWMQYYAEAMELDVWGSTTLSQPVWTGEMWQVTLTTQLEAGTVQKRTLFPRHIIQATGQAGEPNVPSIPGMDQFRGSRIYHSSQFKGAQPNGQGKRAVVIGSSNSAHDIAQDYHQKGYHVTMIQRSSVTVDPSRYFKGKGLYTEDGPNTEDADLLSYSMPLPVLKRNEIEGTKKLQVQYKKFFTDLEDAGLKLDIGPDGAGRKLKFLEKGGGYYINVGASELIIGGHIKIKQGQEVSEITANGMVLTDGTHLPADEIVFATGYRSMKDTAKNIFGESVASKLKDVWGLDEEGELKSVWRRSGHPGFWFVAGNLALSRYYSRLLALQIKAIEEGLVGCDD